jgi:putative nucleotidyltransferase with HDIG domain
VGAYYHDIGRLVQPCFFFENQNDGSNPHEGTSPADSADIIMSHVKDGLAIAEQYSLPAPVVAVIAEHHGTSLVRYFYHAAKKRDVAVYESDFRYQGRRPRSKEAGIVMLADASEASIRAMTAPELHQVEAAVQAVIDERGGDAQLVDSGLTTDDLSRIAAVFVTQLMGFRHARCPYPAYAELASEGTCECR